MGKDAQMATIKIQGLVSTKNVGDFDPLVTRFEITLSLQGNWSSSATLIWLLNAPHEIHSRKLEVSW